MDAHGPLSDQGLVQLLNRHGERLEDERFSRYAADLDLEALLAMWHDMTVVRAFDLEATSLQRQGELGLWVPSLGQEAAQIGAGHALRESDFVFPSYREHGIALTRGVDLPEILRIFRGLQHGAWDAAEHGFHLYTLVIGAHSLHATGYALAMDRDGLVGTGADSDGAVLCCFGDGATSQGDVNEALTFAAVNNAPIVFMVQNNQFAISEPTTRQSRVPLAQRGSGFGIPAVRYDGNDVVASYAVARWALEHARSGQGPVLIEAFTYRMGAHTTSDDPSKYRSQADESYWAERDPISRLEAYLRAQGALTDDAVDAARAEAKELGRRTREAVKGWERPAVASIFDHVYAEPHATVEAERAWFARYEASFADQGVRA
ncbi:pyruvate dehydrogenase (acetyl-transferring) E1 component subunit alpha [Demequina sp. SYSU T0a273]|uniref:Pyruvate dehydrogenase (Acetyl-transferring) E1 component subunit alpha n=1 Tax=Demequina lignilytica TaxID=3051663 RepID=A0AB35MKJ4_9MICO|nr:pyruvate dehydrogenase (acetyl-transferring) E1 component subunit alpha [Demequina sp. SYSU T0a273]MDN4484314.1 pyruvate dehydrogenase (acetyl-transferring) E1 component subunit alpha [Demequina sp. SYSU T0a273]